jgi:hypothetical protein
MRIATRAEFRRLALVALLALAAQALLPYLHANASFEAGGGANHSAADCAVCGALAHGGARAGRARVASSFALSPSRLTCARRSGVSVSADSARGARQLLCSGGSRPDETL